MFGRLWAGRDKARAAMAEARTLLEQEEKKRWQLLLARLGWVNQANKTREGRVLGWPADQLASSILSALLLEQHASNEVLQESLARKEYAHSLEAELTRQRQMREEAERDAKSLEAERDARNVRRAGAEGL